MPVIAELADALIALVGYLWSRKLYRRDPTR
jgi:hypothetical protein